MKNLATPLGLAGFGSHSEADRSRNQFFNWHVVTIALFVFAGYFLGAKIGFALTFQPHPVSVLWPPNSILLAALLLTPVRIWWVILLAAFPAHLAAQLESGVPPAMILCWFISNSCEALIGAGCVRYLIDRPVRFDRLRNVGIFCFFAAFLGHFLSSFLDAAFVIFNRWGEQIFSSEKSTDGWDGKYKGTYVQQGAYAYVVDVTDDSGKHIQSKGTVMVIR
jgi:gliding motility-associated-like protein